MPGLHNILILNVIIWSQALLISGCKSRTDVSRLASDGAQARAILEQLDRDWEGLTAVLALNEDFMGATAERRLFRNKYRALQPCNPEYDGADCKDPWSQYEVISADTTKETNQGEIIPRLVKFKAALPSGATHVVSVGLTVDDIVRTTAIAQNLVAQGASNFYNDLKVRRLSTPFGNVIGFNFLNDPSDWEDGANPLAEDTETTAIDRESVEDVAAPNAAGGTEAASSQDTQRAEIDASSEDPFEFLKTDGGEKPAGTTTGDTGDKDFPSVPKGEVCTDGNCGLLAEVVATSESPLSYAEGEEETAASALLGIPSSQVKLPLYGLRTLHEQARNEAFANVIKPGDVFTMYKNGEIVGSGFGVWLAKNPIPLDIFRDRLDVLVFGRVTNLSDLYKLNDALDPKNQQGPSRLEATVTASRVDRFTDSQDLMQFGGELYELSRDEIWGTIAFETFRDRKPTTLFLNKNSKKRGAISVDGANTDQVLVAKRVAELKEINDHVSEALSNLEVQVGQYSPNTQQLSSNGKLQQNFVPGTGAFATQEFFERFNNLDEILTKEKPIFNKLAFAAQISFFQNYFLGLRKASYSKSGGIVEQVEAILGVLRDLTEHDDALRVSYDAAFGSLNHFGMRKKISEEVIKQFVSLNHFGAGLSTGVKMLVLFSATGDHFMNNLKFWQGKTDKGYNYDFYNWSTPFAPKSWTWLPESLRTSKKELRDSFSDWMRYSQYSKILHGFTGEYPPAWEKKLSRAKPRGGNSSTLTSWEAERKAVNEFNSDEKKVERFLSYLNRNRNYLKIYLGFDSFQINKGRGKEGQKECLVLWGAAINYNKVMDVGHSRRSYLPLVTEKFTVLMKNLMIKAQALNGLVSIANELQLTLDKEVTNQK